MDEKFYEKLEKMDSRLDSIDKTLVKQEVNLDNHIKRTDLLEKHTDKLFRELEPIKKHVNHVEGGMKLLGLLSLVIGVVAGIIALLQHLL